MGRRPKEKLPPVKVEDLTLDQFYFHKPSLATRFSQEEIANTIEECCGVKWSICKKLGCTPYQLTRYFETHEALRELFRHCQDGLLLQAEGILQDNLQSKDPDVRTRAAEFVVKTMGQKATVQQTINISSEKDKILKVNQIFGVDNGEVEEP